MELRAARESDLAIIADFATSAEELYFVHPSARYPLTAHQLLPNFQQRKGNSVITHEGAVIGFANYINVIEGESATIGNVIIDPAQRGRGAGKALLLAMERMAKEQYQVRLSIIPCFNTNTYGLHFYHNLGYVPCKGEPRLDQNQQPVFLIYLQKPLT